MGTHKCALSALTLTAAMTLGAAAIAADLPKEGTYNGSGSGTGSFQATPVGKERLLVVFDNVVVVLSNGLLDHTTWHCWGLGDFTSGKGDSHGYCVTTDTDGDKVVGDFANDGRYAMDSKSIDGTVTITTGTGKYTGISGSWKYVLHGNEFRTAAEGTFVNNFTFQGNYKLP